MSGEDVIRQATGIIKEAKKKAEKKGERKPASEEHNHAMIMMTLDLMKPVDYIFAIGIRQYLNAGEEIGGMMGRRAAEKALIIILDNTEYHERINNLSDAIERMKEENVNPDQEIPIERIISIDPLAAYLAAEFGMFITKTIEIND